MKKTSEARLKPVLSIDGFDRADAAALQAMATGTANELQQKRALNVIIYKLCGFDDISFRSGRPDETAFLEGMRFVARKIQHLLEINPHTFKENYD